MDLEGERGEHLEDELLVAFVAGRMTESERAEVEGHIDACTACRELVSLLAGASTASLAGGTPEVDALATTDAESPPSEDDPDSRAPPLLAGSRRTSPSIRPTRR